MSETVPQFLLGQSVRVMQTSDMVKLGIANYRAIVLSHPKGKESVCVSLESPMVGWTTCDLPAAVLMVEGKK